MNIVGNVLRIFVTVTATDGQFCSINISWIVQPRRYIHGPTYMVWRGYTKLYIKQLLKMNPECMIRYR